MKQLEDAVDAADQLDFPSQVKESSRTLKKKQADEDFDSFTQSAQSLEVPKETRDGNIVLTTGGIRPENKTSGGEKPKESSIPAARSAVTPEKEEPSSEPNVNTATAAAKDHENVSTPLQKHYRFVTAKDFDLLKVIGVGAFGKVLQVRHKHTQRILAMKVISKRLLRKGSGYVENVQAERKILTRVRSPFVVTMHCSFQTKEKLFIIMDFLAGGELFLKLGREGIFLEKEACFYLAEILLALDHLHSLGILHRDLKPENILLGEDGHVCVTDFGLAKDFSDSGGFQNEGDESRALTICGTQEYMAPEMLSRQGYGRPADYWSLGCIAYEMLSGLPPFRSKQGGKDLFRKIMSEKVKMPPGSTAAACKLLKGLLNRNVLARLGTTRSTMFEVGGVAALKKLDFFKAIDWEKLERKEMDPPHVQSVADDKDLQHFHKEFTGMALPRSVLEMSRDDFRPRRVQSDAFRGFSFIMDDFDLPERDESELQSYWDSVEEDGESLSECASSKLDLEEALPEPVSEKKKRPPRKRKKKKKPDAASQAAAAVALGPPCCNKDTAASVASATPAPSENGEESLRNAQSKPLQLDSTQSPDQSSTLASSPSREPGYNRSEASNDNSVPATPPRTAPVKETWQNVGAPSGKKKGANRSKQTQSSQLYQKRLQPMRTLPNAVVPRVGVNAKRRDLLQAQQRPAGPAQPHQPASRPTPWSKNVQQGEFSRIHSPAHLASNDPGLPSAPSSDWRKHAMSPRSGSTKPTMAVNPSLFPSLTVSSFPSLTSDPPLNPNAKPKTVKKLQGAWATKAKA